MKSIRAAIITVLAGVLAAAFAAKAGAAIDDSRVCGLETARQERLQMVPDRLLHAISLVESGRWDADRQASFAWPWTVTAEGEGHYLPSKDAAVAEVQKLRARGVTNIDVGCMQVNLQAHPDAFHSIDEALDPAANVAYGARFLNELHASTQNWYTAAAYYHSQTPALAEAYKVKLVAAWNAARNRPDDRLQLAVALENRPPVGFFLPVPPHDPADLSADLVANQAHRNALLERTQAERAEAKRIADAYREARLQEYRQRKLQLGDSRG